jgi:hypothetical protein
LLIGKFRLQIRLRGITVKPPRQDNKEVRRLSLVSMVFGDHNSKPALPWCLLCNYVEVWRIAGVAETILGEIASGHTRIVWSHHISYENRGIPAGWGLKLFYSVSRIAVESTFVRLHRLVQPRIYVHEYENDTFYVTILIIMKIPRADISALQNMPKYNITFLENKIVEFGARL